MAQRNNSSNIIAYAAAAAGLFLVYKIVGGAESLFESLGLKDSADTTNLDTQAGSSNNFWSPNFYKQGPAGTKLLTVAGAKDLAQTIYDAFGAFNDDEDAAIGALHSLRTQSQVSFLASVFYQEYQQDLFTFLRGGNYPQDRLSDQDLNAVNSYLSSLPKYM